MPAMPRISPPEGLEGHMVQRLHAIWCQDGKILYFQAKVARLHQGTVDVQRDSMAHHHVGELLGIGVPGGHISDITSLAQNSYPVGDIHYLVELVGDDDHGFAVGFHVAHDIKEPVGFLRSEDSGGLVQNQNVCAPVEYFDDFHRLLFGDRHVINFFVGVDDEAILLADFRNPGGCGFEVQLAGLFQASTIFSAAVKMSTSLKC